jgi:hypothetical protein
VKIKRPENGDLFPEINQRFQKTLPTVLEVLADFCQYLPDWSNLQT